MTAAPAALTSLWSPEVLAAFEKLSATDPDVFAAITRDSRRLRKRKATDTRATDDTEQRVRTPDVLIDAIERRFGPLTIDLAASDGDEITHRIAWPDNESRSGVHHITPEQDSLKVDWPAQMHGWLNPEYGNIDPFVAKCARWARDVDTEPGSLIHVLVPASVDAEWWRLHVRGRARVEAIPRVRFIGHKHTFPKPLALLHYDPMFPAQPADVGFWNWRDS